MCGVIRGTDPPYAKAAPNWQSIDLLSSTAVNKYPRIESHLLEAVTSAVAACWEKVSPVAGQSAERRNKIAQLAIRQIRGWHLTPLTMFST